VKWENGEQENVVL